MGARNPDRIVQPPSPMQAMTLAEMHVLGWELRAHCQRCGLSLRANVAALIKASGPDAIWWGVSPPCPGFDCRDGKLVYGARATPSGSWSSMARPPDTRLVEAWKAKRRPRDQGPR
jgi:hypothetical protein